MDARSYLESRGVSAEVAEAAGARAKDGRVWLPWRDPDGTEIYRTGRALDGQDPKYLHSPGRRPPLYAAPGAWEKPGAVLAEGHIDALALASDGWGAFATAGSSLPDEAVPLLAGKHVVAVPDNDDGGERWLADCSRKLSGVAASLKVARAQGYKDVAEAAAAGVRPGEIVRAATDLPYIPYSSWGPDETDGEESPPVRLARTDGERLLYPGKRHSLQGEPESGKTFAALLASTEALRDGGRVLFVDFEDSGASVRSRLRAMGAPLDGFTYVRPAEPLSGDAVRDVEHLMAQRPAVVVLDGVAEAMALHGLDPIRAMDVATFFAEVVSRFEAPKTSTVLIDHVARGEAGKGRYAYGSQHKLAGIDGAAYRFEVLQPFSRERGGAARIDVVKDRPGFVRSFALDKDRAGVVRVVPGEDGLSVSIDPPMELEEDGLSYTQARVHAVLDGPDGGGLTYMEVGDRLAGDGKGKPLKRTTIQKALDVLMDEGLADGVRSEGGRSSRFWRTG